MPFKEKVGSAGEICFDFSLFIGVRGWSATLAWMKYCGTAGKPGGRQRKKPHPTGRGVSSLLEQHRNTFVVEVALRRFIQFCLDLIVFCAIL
jgi:hypothetical protein